MLLHSVLLTERFGDYVNALPPGSPLFPDATVGATFGSRAETVSKNVSTWLRKTLGITDPAISPNHTWRDWFEDASRGAGIPQEVRSTGTGHSNKVDEGESYRVGRAARRPRARTPAGGANKGGAGSSRDRKRPAIPGRTRPVTLSGNCIAGCC